MNKGSDAAQAELVTEFVLWALRRGNGQMPVIKRSTLNSTARMLHLAAGLVPDTWIAREELEPLLEVAGRDKSGRIVDYERYYANREAWEEKRKRKRLRRKT